MSEENNGGSGFSWFLAGLGLGALVGVLFAPKSGKETREDIVTGAREGTEYLRQRSREAADQVHEYVDRGKVQVGEYVERGREYVSKSRAQLDDLVSHGRQFVEEQKGKVAAAVDAGKEAYVNTTTTGGGTPTE